MSENLTLPLRLEFLSFLKTRVTTIRLHFKRAFPIHVECICYLDNWRIFNRCRRKMKRLGVRVIFCLLFSSQGLAQSSLHPTPAAITLSPTPKAITLNPADAFELANEKIELGNAPIKIDTLISPTNIPTLPPIGIKGYDYKDDADVGDQKIVKEATTRPPTGSPINLPTIDGVDNDFKNFVNVFDKKIVQELTTRAPTASPITLPPIDGVDKDHDVHPTYDWKATLNPTLSTVTFSAKTLAPVATAHPTPAHKSGTPIPTTFPSEENSKPTTSPTEESTLAPTEESTLAPTEESTLTPSLAPTEELTLAPTEESTLAPTEEGKKTLAPTRLHRTMLPTAATPSYSPTSLTPTLAPTQLHHVITATTAAPSYSPTSTTPSVSSTSASPTFRVKPTQNPSFKPTPYPSSALPTPSPTAWYSCFAASESLLLENGDTRLISNLQVGDRVLSSTMNGSLSFSAVVALPHTRNTIESDFVKLSTEVGGGILLTADHLISVADGACDKQSNFKLVAAGNVKLGSCVQHVDGPQLVTAKELVRRNGVYTAVTMNPLLVVNGIIASPFVNHAAGNSFYNIHRALYAVAPWVMDSAWVTRGIAIFGDMGTNVLQLLS